MNTEQKDVRKLPLKRASQMRKVGEFSKEELEQINKIRKTQQPVNSRKIDDIEIDIDV
jgi:hypothetical protein